MVLNRAIKTATEFLLQRRWVSHLTTHMVDSILGCAALPNWRRTWETILDLFATVMTNDESHVLQYVWSFSCNINLISTSDNLLIKSFRAFINHICIFIFPFKALFFWCSILSLKKKKMKKHEYCCHSEISYPTMATIGCFISIELPAPGLRKSSQSHGSDLDEVLDFCFLPSLALATAVMEEVYRMIQALRLFLSLSASLNWYFLYVIFPLLKAMLKSPYILRMLFATWILMFYFLGQLTFYQIKHCLMKSML